MVGILNRLQFIVILFSCLITMFYFPSLLIGDAENNNVVGNGHKRNTTRRREPRRHTLQNGIDYNMVIDTFYSLLIFACLVLNQKFNWFCDYFIIFPAETYEADGTGKGTIARGPSSCGKST